MPPLADEKVEQNVQETASNESSTTNSQESNVKQTPAQERQQGQDDFDSAFAKPPKAEKAVKGEKASKQQKTTVEKKDNNQEVKVEKTNETKLKEEVIAKEKTAQEKLEERANKFDGGDNGKSKEAEVKKIEEKPVQQDTKPVEKPVERKPFEITPESMQKVRDAMTSGSVKIGNSDVNMKQFAEDYPDEFNVMTATAMHVAKQMIDSQPIQETVTRKDIDDIRAELAHRGFMESVMRKHSDVHEIIKSEGYNAWINKQPSGVKKMAESSDPDDADFILSAYKETIGKVNSIKEADKAKADKVRRDALLEDSSSSNSNPKNYAQTSKDSKNDFGAGFDETED